MKYRDEYRDPVAVRRMAEKIAKTATRPWTIMEVCGGQTHTIVRYGLDRLLPEAVTLVHGPGCPVCVTPVDYIDKAVDIARRPEVVFCSFGDMLRVPASRGDLLRAKSEGADVRIVYSPLDALEIARQNRDRQVVFFAVGFETTAPANAMAVYQAKREGISNFSLLVSQVLVPPAIEAILSSETNHVQGFLAAGHVCTIMGFEEYAPLARRHRTPIVVTGFEPLDILEGIQMCVRQLEEGRAEVENQYSRAVRRRTSCDRFSASYRASGGASARLPPAALASPKTMPRSMLRTASGGSSAKRPVTAPASPAPSSGATGNRRSARPSAPPAHRSIPWVSPWSRARGPVQPITATGPWRNR